MTKNGKFVDLIKIDVVSGLRKDKYIFLNKVLSRNY